MCIHEPVLVIAWPLHQGCQTQTHLRAAQLNSKTEKLSEGRSFETFSDSETLYIKNV